MKKISFIVLCFFLNIILVSADTIILEECEYTEEYKKYLLLSDSERENVLEPVKCENNVLNNYSVGNTKVVNASVTDSKFSLVEHNYVPGVKDQNNTSACWAFSTNTAIESNLLLNNMGTYDLSEAHLELRTQDTYIHNALSFSRNKDSGGNTYISSAYLNNFWGPIKEEELTFSKLEKIYNNEFLIMSPEITDKKSILDVNYITMFGNEGACSSNTITSIKDYLINNGALTSTIYKGNVSDHNLYLYYDGSSYQTATGENVPSNQVINHAVTIVGWDDTISKDNFYGENKPSRNGAFLVQNSFGTKTEVDLNTFRNSLFESNKEGFIEQGVNSGVELPNNIVLEAFAFLNKLEKERVSIENDKIIVSVGNNGYQYISYDDVRVCGNITGFYNIDKEVEDNVYGYDTLGLSHSYLLNGKTGYLASVFEKKTEGVETLEEVNIYFSKSGLKYEIYFAEGETKDINGANIIGRGTSKFSGFQTIKFFPKRKIISDKFSIIIRITDEEENLRLGVASKDAFRENVQFTSGVQFISLDGVEYADVTEGTDKFHLLVKAYTNIVEEDTEIVPPVDTEEDNTTPDNTDNLEKYDKPVIDNTNNDGHIEVKPNDTSNENGTSGDTNEVDTPIENPKTGTISLIIFMSSLIVLLNIIKVFKNKNKVFKI